MGSHRSQKSISCRSSGAEPDTAVQNRLHRQQSLQPREHAELVLPADCEVRSPVCRLTTTTPSPVVSLVYP